MALHKIDLLIKTVKRNYIDDKDPSVNAKNDKGYTALHQAELTTKDKDPSVNAKNDKGYTALYQAELTTKDKDPSVNAKDNRGYTALYYAFNGRYDDCIEAAIKLLVCNGASIDNCKNSKFDDLAKSLSADYIKFEVKIDQLLTIKQMIKNTDVRNMFSISKTMRCEKTNYTGEEQILEILPNNIKTIIAANLSRSNDDLINNDKVIELIREGNKAVSESTENIEIKDVLKHYCVKDENVEIFSKCMSPFRQEALKIAYKKDIESNKSFVQRELNNKKHSNIIHSSI